MSQRARYIFVILLIPLIGIIFMKNVKLEAISKARSQPRAQSQGQPPSQQPSSQDTASSQNPIQSAQKEMPDEQGVNKSNLPVDTQTMMPSDLPMPPTVDPGVKLLTSDFIYDPTGRRDPFKSFIQLKKEPLIGKTTSQTPSVVVPSKALDIGPYFSQIQASGDSIEGYTVDELRLVGIMWDIHDPKAMLKSPSNKVFMVHKQSRIGKNNGYVAAIREGEVVVVEIAQDGKTPSTRVLTLQK